jgi:hypothetical protein
LLPQCDTRPNALRRVTTLHSVQADALERQAGGGTADQARPSIGNNEDNYWMIEKIRSLT